MVTEITVVAYLYLYFSFIVFRLSFIVYRLCKSSLVLLRHDPRTDSTAQLGHRSQLMLTLPISVTNCPGSLGVALPVAVMGQQKYFPIDFGLPGSALPVQERNAAGGMLTPVRGIFRPMLEAVLTNPTGPFFTIPGYKLHGVLRPGLTDRLVIGITAQGISQFRSQHRGKQNRQT